ncbi:DUF3810 family protein [Lewinella sp. IMCC34183]|uniref:DUF3810 family protein n=1 Tax=Lewinella sp. IMCC34183 TaxID=2248762 RepID=UPI000E247F6C|nr:DUF3810 family protein [Lewinella sp. IMCC34183]
MVESPGPVPPPPTASGRSLHPRPAALLPLVGMTLLSLALRRLLPASVIENWFSRGWFPGVRWVWDNTLGWLPFPVFYLFWVGVAAWLGYEVIRFRRIRTGPRPARMRYALSGFAGRLTILVLSLLLFFLWSWGFNYGRVPVETQLGFLPYSPELDELQDRVYTMAGRLSELRAEVTDDTLALTDVDFPADAEAAVRPLVAAALRRRGYPTPGRPRGWELLPRGILLRLGTAGVYWPWAAQGNIDAGLHPLQKPAVLAHELAHAYGFGDEGTCSFWSYLSAEEAADPALRYALVLAYWRQIAGQLRYADPEGYLAWRASVLDPGIRNDLQAIYDNGARYTDLAPALRDATYTVYLQAQGIHEGLLNYGRVVQLVEGYRRGATPES